MINGVEVCVRGFRSGFGVKLPISLMQLSQSQGG